MSYKESSVPTNLRDHLILPYSELEEFNLRQKSEQASGKPESFFQEKVLSLLEKEKGIKSVMIGFSNIEGKLLTLDYDKKFFISAFSNLTFDGSSVSGFTELGSSDLRLKPDFGSFRILPSDIFGAGKVILFATVCDKDGSQFASDFRGRLKEKLQELKKNDTSFLVAPEIEGFLIKGENAEQHYTQQEGFSLSTTGGYFNTLPQDSLRQFIDTVAEVQRALGFENEKDHGEVAPSQFEINFKYADALITADQILLYKLICRQVAKCMGFTATFLPKPISGINGNGMHSNISLAQGGKNIFYDAKGEDGLSETGQKFVEGVLRRAKEITALYCSSVNAYRRLDPNFEAPNAIQKSACDRGSIIRIPLGNEKSARMELRPVSPDANPYLTYFTVLFAGEEGMNLSDNDYKNTKKNRESSSVEKIYSNFGDALEGFKNSEFSKTVLGEFAHEKFYEIKKSVIDRSPRELGTLVKSGEVIYHHEVTNQVLWDQF